MSRAKPEAPRHALDSELTNRPPDARLRAELSSFYRTSESYALQQSSHSPEYFGRLLSVMNEVLRQPRLRIVEIGGGSGMAMQSFLETRPDARAVVLELSPSLLRAARTSRGSRLSVVAGDALQLPFCDHSVDSVVAFEVIEHLPDVAQALEELLRVVRVHGHIVIGLPNHASLWTPVQDVLKRRNRRAFGIERGRGAWRWWRRNAALMLRKRLSSRAEFLYREPVLDGVQGGDADAIYYAAPIDLLRFFQNRHLELVATNAEVHFGKAGRLLPVELQGSTVMAWRTRGRPTPGR